MDFGCYNALYSLYYLGRPETVYAYALHLRPNDFPQVEDGATMVLTYKNAVAILERVLDRHCLTVKAIVVTHAHIDHIGGAAKLKVMTGAPVYLNPEDFEQYAKRD